MLTLRDNQDGSIVVESNSESLTVQAIQTHGHPIYVIRGANVTMNLQLTYIDHEIAALYTINYKAKNGELILDSNEVTLVLRDGYMRELAARLFRAIDNAEYAV